MITIVFGNEPLLIKNKIDSIILENKDSLVTKFNCYHKEFDVNTIVDACKSVGLFNDSTLVLVKDPEFLSKKNDSTDISLLLDYCKHPLYENNLVFYTFDNTFNERLNIFKEIAINAEVIKFNQLPKKDFFDEAKRIINNSKLNITKEASDYLINSVNLSLTLLNENIEVLRLYPDRIDLEAIRKLITISSDEDTFSLINALTSKQVSLSIKYANKLLDNDESVLKLVASIASQLRFLYSVAYYRSIGKTNKEIMTILNIKTSYRLDKAIESLEKVDMNTIEELLSKLCNLDYSLKKNDDIDEKLKLELFIVELLK